MAAEEQENELKAVLRVLRDNALATISLYHRNGPRWTGKDGREYYDASYVIEIAEETLRYIRQVLPE